MSLQLTAPLPKNDGGARERDPPARNARSAPLPGAWVITGFRRFRPLAVVTASIGSRSIRLAAIVAMHGAALLAVYLTEYGPFAVTLALLTWVFLNCFWLIVLRRPAMAAALSLVMIASTIMLSQFKYSILDTTLSFFDLLIVDPDTIAFLLTIFPDLRTAVVV